MRKTMSSDSLHCMTGEMGSTLHRFMLHFLNCNRFVSHLPGHFPAPSGGELTNFTRLRVPPSQSFEHHDHFVHSLSSQSFSQLCPLHAIDSEVEPHGLPPYFIGVFTLRT